MMRQTVGVFAKLEREMMRERTHAGLESASKKGRHPERKRTLSDDERWRIHDLVQSGERTKAAFARLFAVNRSTINRVMQEPTSNAAA